jgi:hypothetical protein
MVQFLNVILLSFNNWNPFVSVPSDQTVFQSTVYVCQAKSTVSQFVLNFHCGALIQFQAQPDNSVIVSQS